MVNVITIYSSTMDPMGNKLSKSCTPWHRRAWTVAPGRTVVEPGLETAPHSPHFSRPESKRMRFLHSHRIHGAAIYGNIYHQYTPVMLAYIPAPWIRHGILGKEPDGTGGLLWSTYPQWTSLGPRAETGTQSAMRSLLHALFEPTDLNVSGHSIKSWGAI